MAYDDDLAQRIRALVATEPGLTEKKMFGGLAFLVGGNMAIAASGEGGILVRVDPDRSDELVADDDGLGGRDAGSVQAGLAPGRRRGPQDETPAGQVGGPRSRLRPIAAGKGIIDVHHDVLSS